MEDPLLGYLFDRGVVTFGRHVDSEVEQAGDRASQGARQRKNRGAAKAAKVMADNARKRKLYELLNITNSTGIYADPLRSAKVEIKTGFSR